MGTEWWIVWCVYVGVSLAQVTSPYTTTTTEKPTAEIWHMERMCGQELETYGGELHFNSDNLRGSSCDVFIKAKGSNETMISLSVTYFNVTSGCLANISLDEPTTGMPWERTGLHKTYCKGNMALNAYSLFTTLGSNLTIKYKVWKKQTEGGTELEQPWNMRFIVKLAAFTSRYGGCRDEELNQGMVTCSQNYRCIHESLLCKNLNPCGNGMDCIDTIGLSGSKQPSKGGLGFGFVMIIILVVVVTLFIIIQVALVLRNEHKLCGYNKQREDGEVTGSFIPDPYVNGRPSTSKQSASAEFISDT